MKILHYIHENRLAFWISFFYVTLGGVIACSMYPDDLLNGDWWFWGWVVTLPVNFLSFSLRFSGDIGYFPVIIIQLIILIPTFLILSRLIPKKKK